MSRLQPTDQQITQLNEIFERGLCKGLGNRNGQMCIEAAISVVFDGRFSGEPSCVSPVDREFMVRLNDASWSSPAARAEGMRPLLLPQLGTAGTDRSTWIERVIIGIVNRVLPVVLDEVVDQKLIDACISADTLAAAGAAADAAYAAAADAAAAYAARAAAAYAARAADVAARAANAAAAYAAAYAAAAADAAADAARAADAADGDQALLVAVGVAVEAYDFDVYRAEERVP